MRSLLHVVVVAWLLLMSPAARRFSGQQQQQHQRTSTSSSLFCTAFAAAAKPPIINGGGAAANNNYIHLASVHRSVVVAPPTNEKKDNEGKKQKEEDSNDGDPEDTHQQQQQQPPQPQHMHLKILYDPSLIQQKSRKKLPVVLFFSGADCPHESYQWLAHRLAVDAGCCVVMSSCVISFQHKTVLLSTPYDVTKLQRPSTEGIVAILDDLRKLNGGGGDDEEASSSSPLRGCLDLDRVIVGGHSTGGRTALDLVAFDNDDRIPANCIKAAFSYGATLVVSGPAMGSVVPCNRRQSLPPPLLMLGGTQDGVSAIMSETGDNASQPYQRSLHEAFRQADGDVDIIMVKGANHMVFCDPVDPTCEMLKNDRPLIGDGERMRDAMGSLICSFLQSHGLTTTTTTTSTTKRIGLGGVQQPPLAEDFLFRIPLNMIDRHESFRSARSETPPFTVLDSERELQELVWEMLENIVDDFITTTIAEHKLEPSTKLAPNARQWSAERVGLIGTLQAWNRPPAVEWAIRYAMEATGGNIFSKSVGFTVWMGPTNVAPHLTMFVGVSGRRVTLMGDHLPRVDLLEDPNYFETYYGGEYATMASNLQQMKGIKTFTSMDPSIRAVQGPNALAFSVEIDEKDALEILRNTLVKHSQTWLGFVRGNEASFQSGATPDTDVYCTTTMAKRDLALRKVLRDHERSAGESVMDTSQANTLANNMVGLFGDAAMSRHFFKSNL